jgi:Sugar (and other) transporter
VDQRYATVDLIVNGSFWLGAALGSGASLLFLDPHILPADLGWRFGFAIGGVLGLGILLLRSYVPESPRWLVIHGWKQKADAAIEDIEQRIRAESGATLVPPHGSITLHPRRSFGLGPIMSAMLGSYRSRSLLALTLMTAQAFLFNAVFFSYGLVLSAFHGVPERTTGIYSAAACGEQLPWAGAARAAVRYLRTSKDDRRNLCGLRVAPLRYRAPARI